MVDGKELFTVMMQEAAKTDSIVLGAIRRLRGTHILTVPRRYMVLIEIHDLRKWSL